MTPVIVWFRQDLRLSDNPALSAAVETGRPILPIYILDDENADDWKMGAASRVWLHHSLLSLHKSLNGNLAVFQGDALEIIQQLVKETGAEHVFWNRCYEPWRIKRDKRSKSDLQDNGINVDSFNGSLLWEPWDVLKKDNTPYKVFTPYYCKGCLNIEPPRLPISAPEDIQFYKLDNNGSVDDLGLLPSLPWGEEIIQDWDIGEEGALTKFTDFYASGLDDYKEGRNVPSQKNVSRLSPHLHFGEVSPNQLWYALEDNPAIDASEKDIDCFKSELGWREFSYYLLYHFPTLPKDNFQDKFDKFPWGWDDEKLAAWQNGQTGYPIIDAAMRELYQTGYMHNRPRMIVGSFLVKNLLIHWHEGEKWFWDCLFDADLASNSASWQWIAGCGADAAPYFRIFNPVTQSQKFDPEGSYIKKYVPELKDVPANLLHEPWEMSISDQRLYNAVIGKDYPLPIIDLKASRAEALAAYDVIKGSS